MSKAERILKQIQIRIGGNVRISRRGVPHLVVSCHAKLYSICYFARSRMLKVFADPYLSTNRQIKTFKRWEKLVYWFEETKLSQRDSVERSVVEVERK